MIKKTLFPLLLLLCLCFLLTACGVKPEESLDGPGMENLPADPALSPEDQEPEKLSITGGDYVGLWGDQTSQRAMLTIVPEEEGQGYLVQLQWGSSAWESMVWTMHAQFNEADGALEYTDGEKALTTYNEDGSIAEKEVEWEDAAGTFRITEDGGLEWSDSRETDCADFDFQRVVMYTPSAEDFAEDYFRVIGGYATGVSGAALAQAIAATEAFGFATENNLWNVDIPTLRETMLTAWESLSQEEQAAFDANFLAVKTLMDQVFSDPEGNRGVFEDAGVGDQLDDLLKREFSRLSWDTLCAHTLTMGNSDE